MFRKIVFYDNFTEALTDTWLSFFLQGVMLIVLGACIALAPQLLTILVASSFTILGIIFITIAIKTRDFKNKYRRWRDEMWEPF